MLQVDRWLRRRRKILHGLYRTHLKRETDNYNPVGWYDKHYSTGISDRQTIEPYTNPITAAYHYASIELIIARELRNNAFSLDERSVFDIGSGAGHWLKFYHSLGAKEVTGIDVSEISVDFIKSTYSGNGISIFQGLFQDHLEMTNQQYDLINAIGVMFHVVDDAEWVRGLTAIANSLKEGGFFIVGGHFGLFSNVNVQYDRENLAYKRLRSKRQWQKQLTSMDFKTVQIHYNPAYLFIKDYIPENNILIARK